MVVGEDSCDSLGLQGDKTSQSKGNQSWILTERTIAKVPMFWPPDAKSWLIGKDPDTGKDQKQKDKRAAEDELIRWHPRLNGHEFEQTPGDGRGQGSLACYTHVVTKGWTQFSNWTTAMINYVEHLFIYLLAISKTQFWVCLTLSILWSDSTISPSPPLEILSVLGTQICNCRQPLLDWQSKGRRCSVSLQTKLCRQPGQMRG